MISKQEYNQLIGKRLSQAMSLLNLNQKKVLALCLENNIQLTQSTLSKLLSGNNVQLLQIAQLCEVIGLNISEILSLNPDAEIHAKKVKKVEQSQIITDARDNAFRGYLGHYYIYFYTTKDEDLLHHGSFSLIEDPETHQCLVDFQFKTGEKNEVGIEIEKHYIGTAHYSIPMQTIYCEIQSTEIGEMSYLLFQYNFLTYQKLECRVAAAITVCSGIKRLPTMHKLLLSRKELLPEDLNYLCGQLKLNSSEILISENGYRAFLQDPDLPSEFSRYFGTDESCDQGFLSSVAKVNYYSFNESLIRDSFLPPLDKMKIICLLRKYSASPRNNKVSRKAEEIIYKFLQLQQREREINSSPK